MAQYPAVREHRFSTGVQRYLDNSEQRYRDRPSVRKRWLIQLSRLDESELADVLEFYIEQQGRLGSFDFEDPWTGAVIANCRFGEDELPVRVDGEFDNTLELSILGPVS